MIVIISKGADLITRPQGVELRHLRYFLLVAEELHFGRAAARAGIEPSPLSRQIVDLEERLGVQLFVRDRRHTELTPAGRLFVEDVRRVFTDLQLSIDRLRLAAAGDGLPLRVGLAEGAAGPTFGRFIQLARGTTPRIPISLIEKPTAKLFGLLLRGGLDAAFTLSASADDAYLDAEAVWRARLYAVVASDHWTASRQSIAMAELHDEQWVLPDSAAMPGYAGQIEALLHRHHVAPAVTTLAGHQNSIVQLAAAGVGIGLVPEGITRGADDAVMIPLADDDAMIEGWFVCPRESRSPLLSKVRELIAQVAEEMANFQRAFP
jgi:DNA-binding transcriptional LysR family regulator